MTKLFSSPYGDLSLQRIPSGDKSLQAWDAADEFLLAHLEEEAKLDNKQGIAIVNDAFGAISCALFKYQRDNIGDSFLSHLAAKKNLSRNNVESDVENYREIRSTDTLENNYDVLLIKVPKSLALLEDQLIQLRAVLSTSSHIIAAGMTKNIHKSTLDLFSRIIGPTRTSLAKKKARLIYSQYSPSCFSEAERFDYFSGKRLLSYRLEGCQFKLLNYPAVFSRSKLDIGTRFFLPHIANLVENQRQIIDLGCGNGALGFMAAISNPDANVTFIDESYQAIESVRKGIDTLPEQYRDNHVAKVNNILSDVAPKEYDLVLCNPPFHQENSMGKQTAYEMFIQAKKVLKEGGSLNIVANRHLQYHHKLKRLYGNCCVIDSNKKFVILQAVK